MAFTNITLGEFLDQLSQRLDDPTNSFFTRDELLNYVTEAFRTWASHTGYWVRRGGFLSTTGVKDYDLPSLVTYTQGINTYFPLALEVTDRDQINTLNYALIEDAIINWSAGWVGTEQFDLDLVLDAMKLGVNAVQLATSLITQVGSQIAQPTPINQYDLPNDLINLRSVYWQVPEGQQYPVARQDQYLRGLINDNSNIPDSYSVVATSPKRIELSPSPSDTGTLVYVQVPGHTILLPTSTGTSLWIPTNFSWAAKWYSLFTLLNAEGERRDKFRADYCMMRIKDSMIVARSFPGILRCWIDDVEVQVTTAWDTDGINPNWRNTTGDPSEMILHSFSTISLSPIPGVTSAHPDGKSSITFDVSANAPIPMSESEYLDIGSDIIQTLLDYSHHLACFKLGGQEFADSIPSYQRFLLQAMSYNAKLKAESNNFQLLKEKPDFPRRSKPSHLDEEAA